jgi:uracil-DNA glycosylase family 4
VIGEAPGKVEDRKGMPWQGQSGRLLQRTMAKYGIDLFEDCICVNAVNCRPADNRTPTSFEVDCCRKVVVENLLWDEAPHVIVLLGSVAIQSFLGSRWPTDLGGVNKWRGFVIPDQDFNCWVVPTFHPSYIMRMDSREAYTVWGQDLQIIRDLVDPDSGPMKVPEYTEPKIVLHKNLNFLKQIKTEEVALDYETTGLKSQGKGHRIICAGLAFDELTAHAFMMPKTKIGRRPFMDLLQHRNIGKIGHNIKFEHNWTKNRYGITINNWIWDSMLAAHQLDNRSRITNLKFQIYMNFGVLIKDEDVGKFIYEKDPSGNGFNFVYDLLAESDGEERLLRHVALDAYWEYRLAKKQMKELDYKYLPF